MFTKDKLLIGMGEAPVFLQPSMANRHGLIAGATGTGKTTTLKVMAESFSDMGVPVFLADIKGDLASVSKRGEENERVEKRVLEMGLEGFGYRSFPVRFWDVYGKMGHPVRTTISEMGPVLLARLLGLTDVQEGVLTIVFRVADDKGLLLLDLKDLRSLVQYIGENNAEFTTSYGNVSKQSVGAILRALLALEDAGGNMFFGEPALRIEDWIQLSEGGRGYVNILHCEKLFQQPLLYSTFLLWMLSELFETLPEVGDMEKPKIVFFFDEAHLVFSDAPKALVQKVEQVVKLIRSKGVGVYFITQSPSDIPDSVLAQLGNKIQHALRAYTPAEQKAIRAAAQSFRPNPSFSTETVITELGTGEALISFLDEAGRPGVVEKAKILPPMSYMGTIDDERRKTEISASDLYGKYDNAVDRESAYELLAKQAKQGAVEAEKQKKAEEKKPEKAAQPKAKATTAKKKSKSAIEKAATSTMNTIGRELGKSLVRGLMGMLKK